MFCSLQEVLHVERKLYLVFEYLDQDLKKYMDANGTTGLPPTVAKVYKPHTHTHTQWMNYLLKYQMLFYL